jgi:nicotinamidase-related amidase
VSDALVMVDVQNDYFPGGALPLVGMEQAAARAAEVLAGARERAMPVLHVQHLSTRPGATFFLPGTPGAEIHSSVRPAAGEPVYQKHFPNAFRDTGLADALAERGIDALVICGAMTHMCIDASARAAFDLGLSVTVVDDACATRDLQHDGRTLPAAEVHAAFMAALAVPYARIAKAADWLAGS